MVCKLMNNSETSKAKEEALNCIKRYRPTYGFDERETVLAIAVALSLRDKKIERMEKVVEAAKEWKKGKDWADRNSELLLSSKMSTQEASIVMDNYFNKEKELLLVLEEYEKETKSKGLCE
jgi:hypothetical protein